VTDESTANLATLPAFVEPMLARSGEAFDSDEYLFEIKWDGIRALLFVEADHKLRLVNRRKIDITIRYPDLASLAALPPGTLLDGEIVCLGASGKPEFNSLQSREQSRTPQRAQWLAKFKPVTFIAFDQLYRDFQPILNLLCQERREILQQTLNAANFPQRLVMSQGVTGEGIAYFKQICDLGLEGLVAKRLSSPYLPGKRTDAWIKIKRQQIYHCVVIGFMPADDGSRDFASLIIAADCDGALVCVGKVGSGFDEALRNQINQYLWSHLTDEPVVPCKEKGRWVEPSLYCSVRCMERTASGQLRAPALIGMIDGITP
jgi:bifunctional non-homologous end joining protein LigD